MTYYEPVTILNLPLRRKQSKIHVTNKISI